jgi:hypothetical protein
MRAATMTRTNKTLYPDIFVVVDGRRGCESCDLELGRVPLADDSGVCILGVIISSVQYKEARV